MKANSPAARTSQSPVLRGFMRATGESGASSSSPKPHQASDHQGHSGHAGQQNPLRLLQLGAGHYQPVDRDRLGSQRVEQLGAIEQPVDREPSKVAVGGRIQ